MAIRPAIACQTPTMIIITAANTVKPTTHPLVSVGLVDGYRDASSVICGSSLSRLGLARHHGGAGCTVWDNPSTGPAPGHHLFGMRLDRRSIMLTRPVMVAAWRRLDGPLPAAARPQ